MLQLFKQHDINLTFSLSNRFKWYFAYFQQMWKIWLVIACNNIKNSFSSKIRLHQMFDLVKTLLFLLHQSQSHRKHWRAKAITLIMVVCSKSKWNHPHSTYAQKLPKLDPPPPCTQLYAFGLTFLYLYIFSIYPPLITNLFTHNF